MFSVLTELFIKRLFQSIKTIHVLKPTILVALRGAQISRLAPFTNRIIDSLREGNGKIAGSYNWKYWKDVWGGGGRKKKRKKKKIIYEAEQMNQPVERGRGCMVICLWYPHAFVCSPRFLMYIISLAQKKNPFHSLHTRLWTISHLRPCYFQTHFAGFLNTKSELGQFGS